ncbi:hypothetical protein I79_024702 [Cricetulus griseus]|uniref:Uncharacterized protein n=1 Tax=Cricetulus griseus TaxID=10029 RepID=G3ILD8_CRIGR|nr:hypothetical protein I79_024702 [Cricetulus griseus]
MGNKRRLQLRLSHPRVETPEGSLNISVLMWHRAGGLFTGGPENGTPSEHVGHSFKQHTGDRTGSRPQ